MSVLSILCFILLTAQCALGYTIILSSGKRIEGTLVSEQEDTVVIKDSQGVLLSFNRNILDLTSMKAVNDSESHSVVIPSQPARMKQPSIVQIADETKKRRTGTGRIYSEDNPQDRGTLSVMGSDTQRMSEPKQKESSETDHRKWESQIRTLKKEVNRLREKWIVAESACEQAKEKQYGERTTPSQRPVSLMTTYKESPKCRIMNEIAAQLQEAESRLEDVREDARRAGVPWELIE